MTILVSGATRVVQESSRAIGVLVVPGMWNNLARVTPGRTWAMDNGAFSGLDVTAFLSMLRRAKAIRGISGIRGPVFVTAPDVVGDAEKTAALFADWQPVLKAMGFPVAFVGQDGLDMRAVPWADLDAVFLGGTTAWKLGPVARDLAAYGAARGKWVHMGRVNSNVRMRHAIRIGCDSVDGSSFSRWSRRYIPAALGQIERFNGGPLFAEFARMED